jgi:hypothetical protein
MTHQRLGFGAASELVWSGQLVHAIGRMLEPLAISELISGAAAF